MALNVDNLEKLLRFVSGKGSFCWTNWRKIKGQHDEGQRDREPLPLRGSPRAPPKTSERYTGAMKTKSQKGTSQRFSFRGPLGDPLGGRFSSRRLSVLLPLIVLPLNLSPN